MQDFGKLVLDRNPKGYKEAEQAVFYPGSMVPGIGESPDMLLQARMAFYPDAQYNRLGVDFHQTPGKILSLTSPLLLTPPSELSFRVPLRLRKHGFWGQRKHTLCFQQLCQ